MPEFTGTYAWLARDPERARRTAAALNLDMVGQDQDQCGSALLIESPPAFAASFAEALLDQVRHSADTPVGSYSGPGRYGLTRMARVPYAGGSDHAVWNDPGFGVPCPMLIQWPDRYYHSSHDTPDRTDPESLALAVRCAATWAGTLAAAGPGEVEALATTTARHARLHALAALSCEPDTLELDRAALAGRAAIRSLARLGRAAPAIERDLAWFIAFLERETPWRASEPPPPSGRVPHRAFAAPLHYHRHLVAGHAALPAETREWLRRLDRDTPDAHVVFELAWFLCDGRRDFAELAAAVRTETGRDVGGPITEFFEILERLGALHWQPVTEARWNTSPRATATR
jgi:hypothetical protein